jgi:hypothetical protein
MRGDVPRQLGLGHDAEIEDGVLETPAGPRRGPPIGRARARGCARASSRNGRSRSSLNSCTCNVAATLLQRCGRPSGRPFEGLRHDACAEAAMGSRFARRPRRRRGGSFLGRARLRQARLRRCALTFCSFALLGLKRRGARSARRLCACAGVAGHDGRAPWRSQASTPANAVMGIAVGAPKRQFAPRIAPASSPGGSQSECAACEVDTPRGHRPAS